MQVKLAVAEQPDGSWMTVNWQVDKHEGHPVTEEDFRSHNRTKQINDNDKKLIEDLLEASAQPKNISDVLNARKEMGSTFDPQFIRNLKTKFNSEKNITSIEEALDDINKNGGSVKYQKKEGTNDVNVLMVQTKEMLDHLGKCKPILFQADTSFGTQAEGYKLYIMVYFSNYTAKWEVANLTLMFTETKNNVKTAIDYLKHSLPYTVNPGTKFIFLTDKDFDYIQVSTFQSIGRKHSLFLKKSFPSFWMKTFSNFPTFWKKTFSNFSSFQFH